MVRGGISSPRCRQTDSNDLLLGFNQALSPLSYGGKHFRARLQTQPTRKTSKTLMLILNKRHRASSMSSKTCLRSHHLSYPATNSGSRTRTDDLKVMDLDVCRLIMSGRGAPFGLCTLLGGAAHHPAVNAMKGQPLRGSASARPHFPKLLLITRADAEVLICLSSRSEAIRRPLRGAG